MLFLSSLDCAERIKAKEKKKRNPNKHNTKIKPQNKKPSKTEIHWRQIYSPLKRMGKKNSTHDKQESDHPMDSCKNLHIPQR